LSSITDPFGAQVSYSHDKMGRLSAVTGANFASVSSYASGIQYRAWGALKALTYGNSKTLALGYDNNLEVTNYEVPGVMKKGYQYYDDGRLKFTQDLLTTNSKFDRLYKYDHMGRTTIALSGAEARGQGPTNDRPYNETMAYDPMGHLTLRELRHWDRFDTTGNETYTNNRRFGWQYDADGRLLSGNGQFLYDAAGQISSFGDGDPYMTDQQLDGDGRRVKSLQRSYDLNTAQWTTEKITYYIHSSVLGKLISEVSAQGAKERSFVYAGGDVMAIQSTAGGPSVLWQHYDASRGSFRSTVPQGGVSELAEMDPMGADAGWMKPLVWPQPNSPGKLEPYYGVPELNGAFSGCVLDDVPVPCDMVTKDGSVPCKDNQCKKGSQFFRAFADGYADYLPSDARYLGRGIAFSDSAAGGSLDELAGLVFLQEPAKASHDKFSGQGPQTTCHIMADVAQNEANTAIYQNPNDFNAALTQFDRTFSDLYVGGPMVSLAEAKRLSPGDLRTINRNEPFTGGSGFRNEYKDSGTEPHPIGGPKADQTHHFAAYLSLGINRQSAIYAYRHYLKSDNEGDLNLGKAAFSLGNQLTRRGTMSTLEQIGAIIRSNFCSGPGHGLYF
jgi:hypothetical protein